MLEQPVRLDFSFKKDYKDEFMKALKILGVTYSASKPTGYCIFFAEEGMWLGKYKFGGSCTKQHDDDPICSKCSGYVGIVGFKHPLPWGHPEEVVGCVTYMDTRLVVAVTEKQVEEILIVAKF